MWGLLILLGVALLLLTGAGTVALIRALIHPIRQTVGGAVARGLPTDPCEAGASAFETVTLRRDDGRELEVWEVVGQRPDGPAILILHGWGDGRLGGLSWLTALLPPASKLILFDSRGHGESKDRGCSFGVKEVGDALAVVQWLRAKKPTRPVVLFGYSMGAVVAISTGAQEEAGVGCVIADSPYRSLEQAVRGVLKMNRLPTWPMVGLAVGWLRWRGAVPRERDAAEITASLTVPLLVMHGGADLLTPLEDARAIARATPRGKLRVFEGCDHLEAASKHPTAYAEEIAAFLDGLPNGEIKKGPAHTNVGPSPSGGEIGKND